MDELMSSQCCVLNPELLCGSPSKELHLEGGMLACCKCIVTKCCLMNKETALTTVLAITHVYVVKFDIICFEMSSKKYRCTCKTLNTDFEAYRHVHCNR